MLLETTSSPKGQVVQIDRAGLPRLGDYLWRPWYARLWWISIALLWTAALIVSLFDIRLHPEEAYIQYLAFVLHPQVALPVLGFGFVWRWLEYQRSNPGEQAEDEEDFYDGVGRTGFDRPISFVSNPHDLSSPLNPANPELLPVSWTRG